MANKFKESIENMNEYKREVISIPAGGTIDLVYKHKIHAHPNDDVRYAYKKAAFYTFREKHGIMRRLYKLEANIVIDPKEISSVDDLDISSLLNDRVRNYILERESNYGFDEPIKYKFYILSEPIELLNEVVIAKQNNHCYFTIDEIYSGKRELTRCNEENKKSKKDLFKELEDKSKIEYVEIDYEALELDKELEEGENILKIIEVKKRNYKARRLKLESFKREKGKLYCEVCGIEDEVVLDVHHDKVTVAEMEEGHVTKLEDLRVICANCHRKVHGYKINVDRLIQIK